MTKSWANDKRWGITIHLGMGYPPIYCQIVDQVHFHVASGHLQPGDKLPTVRELAQALEINFNTVSKAYHELSVQGVLLGRKGGGSSITKVPPLLYDTGKQKKMLILYQKLVSEAASYGVSADEIRNFIKKEKS